MFLGLKHVKCVTATDGGDHFVTILAEESPVEFRIPASSSTHITVRDFIGENCPFFLA
jgi:hypothetical protein